MNFSKLFILISALCFSSAVTAATSDTTLGRGVASASEKAADVSKTANQTADVGRGVSDISKAAGGNTNTVSGATGAAKSAASGADGAAKALDKLTGSNVANSIGNTTSQIGSTATNVGNLGQGVSNIGGAFNNAGSIDSALGGANSAIGGINSSAGALDKIFGSSMGDSIKGETNALGELSKSVGDISGIMNGVTGEIDSIKSLIDNPQALMNMALGQIDFQKITQIAMNVAEEQIMELLMTKKPSDSSSIPIMTPGLQAQKAIQENTEKEMSDIDKKIQEEKDKQLEAQGGKPATPAPEQTGTNNNDTAAAQQNPSVDNCAAYMAQFPWATSIAYDVVKENVLPEGKNSKYAPGQESWDKAVEFVKSNFYIKDRAKLTPAEQKRITLKRQEYFYEVNANLITTSLLIQQGLVEDAKSISKAPTSGCNKFDDININTQTMMVISKQLMADIALQIRMLELEAMRELTTQPVFLKSEPQYQDPMGFLTKQNEAAGAAQAQPQTPAKGK